LEEIKLTDRWTDRHFLPIQALAIIEKSKHPPHFTREG